MSKFNYKKFLIENKLTLEQRLTHNGRPTAYTIEKDVEEYTVGEDENEFEDHDYGGYIESMGPEFEEACNQLAAAWEQWKQGPATEPGQIVEAKKDVIRYIYKKLDSQDVDNDDDGKTYDQEHGETHGY